MNDQLDNISKLLAQLVEQTDSINAEVSSLKKEVHEVYKKIETVHGDALTEL